MPLSGQALWDFVTELAPLKLAEEWDNPGLQVGDPAMQVKRVLLALDVDAAVCREAEEAGAQLIISHHPLFFKAVKQIRLDRPKGALVARLLGAGITVYAAHTNLDSAAGGVNAVLAQRLGLQEVTVLRPGYREKYLKLVVFVPPSHEGVVREALGTAGAGWIGNYSECTFQVRGTGTFRPQEGTNPYLGKQGELERVEEIRLETILPEKLARQAVGAMLRVHPYEEVAYDLYPLANAGPADGPGRVGVLPAPLTLRDFCRQVKAALDLTAVRYGGPPACPVNKVAVCGGAGADLWRQARDAGADVLVTGDVGYHAARDMLAAGLCFVDAGHFGSERVILPVLRDYLLSRCREAGADVTVLLARSEQDPFLEPV